MRQLIAFVGFKSAGKNTAAQLLVDHYDFTTLSFADAIKDALASIFCWPRDLLEGISAESRTWREIVDPWWATRLGIPEFSPRWAMMHFGTDIMRQHFHPQMWVLNIERRIELLADRPVALTDARFPNELALVRHFNGHVVRIQRGPDPNWMPIAARANAGSERDRQAMHALGIHPSEWSWIGCQVDATLPNDDGIAELRASVLGWCQLELAQQVPAQHADRTKGHPGP